jgi:dGTPase
LAIIKNKFFTKIKNKMENIELTPEIVKEILLNNRQRERNTFSKYACISFASQRYEEETDPDKTNIRPSFFRDTDKIIHSLAYTRYIDKTQVFYLFENDHITHRVLHVQLVSKIARVIGRSLRLNEDLIEAIALGHDLGHVPYGHAGEKRLNEITKKLSEEYFYHNVQSVRILRFIENKGKGLNISLQVLDGILCHNGELVLEEYVPNYKKKLDQFEDEYLQCWNVENFSQNLTPMTLEGCVVRIADIIAYLGRDFEDAITLGIINREDMPELSASVLGNTNSTLINNIVLDLINNSYGKNYIKLSPKIHSAIKDFYKFSLVHIYNNPEKISQDYKIDLAFQSLFNYFLDDITTGKLTTQIKRDFLDNMTHEYKEKNSPVRIVCDYIAGMTDDYFNNQYRLSVLPLSFGMQLTKKA